MLTPDYIGKFQIESVLGRGAMGVVYRGRDEAIARDVAIKTIHPHLLDGDSGDILRERFKTEAMAAGKCAHANIVTVYEYGEHEDMPYIAMEYVEGIELKKLMSREKTFSLKRINRILQQVLRGLDYAHQNGIVHRDIKPANIIILDSGIVKLADFGIARIDTSDVTQLGDVLGTPFYMSPEQSRGEETIDQRSDIFSLGVVLFEMLTFCDDWGDEARTHRVRAILDLPQSRALDYTQRFPGPVAEFFNRCLAMEPGRRVGGVRPFFKAYKTALEAAARPARAEVETSVSPDGESPRSQAEKAWLENRLAAIEESVREYLGPLAGTIVRSKFEASGNIRRAIDDIAVEIPDEKERRAFLRVWTSSASSASSEAGVGTRARKPAVDVDPAELETLRQKLAFFLGPIAEHVVRTKVEQAKSVPHLVELLASEIPAEEERAEFLQEAGR